MSYLGDFAINATVSFPFTTHAAAGGAVAPLTAFEAEDICIYKGNSAVQRASAAGITMTSPFGVVTGLHMVAIDLSDDSDAGFYAAGNEYHVILVPDTETVDGQTVVKVLASFSIARALAATHGTAQSGDTYAYLGTNLGALGANATEAGGTGDQFTALPAVTLANGAHGGGAATLTLASASTGVITGSLSGSVGSVAGNVTGSVGSVAGNVTGSVGSVAGNVTGSVGSVAGNVAGNVVGSVGSLVGFNVTGTGLTAIPWNVVWDAEVQSECNDALIALGYTAIVAGRIDVAVSTRATPADVTTTVTIYDGD